MKRRGQVEGTIKENPNTTTQQWINPGRCDHASPFSSRPCSTPALSPVEQRVALGARSGTTGVSTALSRIAVAGTWQGGSVMPAAVCGAVGFPRKLSSLPDAEDTHPERWLEEPEFHHLADGILAGLEDMIEEGLEHLDEFDIQNAQGVLTTSLGDHGVYVINKQTPNRQIWWSSPISGPKRFYYDKGSGTWRATRDGVELVSLLQEEIRESVGVELDWPEF